MQFRAIKGFSNVFVDEASGLFFTVKNGKDVPLKPQPHTPKPTISINGVAYSILSLLLATYDFKYSDTDRIGYKVSKSGFISPSTIKIRSIGNLSSEDDVLCLKYRCDTKANSANSRFRDKISKGTILQVLRISDFKCVYCGCDIEPDDWHLDHYHPKAAGGVNVIENLAPSCSVCNQMKGALDGINFLKRCKRICLHNKLLNSEEINKFCGDWDSINQKREEVDRLKKSFDAKKRHKTEQDRKNKLLLLQNDAL